VRSASFVEYSLEVTYQTLHGGFGRAILFEHRDFNGSYQMIESSDQNLVLSGWNDKASSMVVLNGAWVFYKDIDKASYTSPGNVAIILRRGMYPWLPDAGMPNDGLSSLRAVAVV